MNGQVASLVAKKDVKRQKQLLWAKAEQVKYVGGSGIRWKVFYRKDIKEMEWLDLESNWQAWIMAEEEGKSCLI